MSTVAWPPPVVDALVVELIDFCNLNCAYCLRDDAALHGRPHALPIPELVRILEGAKNLSPRSEVHFTGGEPTLHPQFRLAIQAVKDIGWRFSLVTNGWTFDRVLPAILEFRCALDEISFSIDGVTREEHDAIRGKGSFGRLMKAALACRQHELPFDFKVTFDRSKAMRLNQFAVFAARLGAQGLQVSPLFPTSPQLAADSMTIEEQQEFLREVGQVRSMHRMKVKVAAGFYDPNPEPTCAPLLGRALSVDYHGRLVLCTVLAGFRGQQQERDVVADLKTVPIDEALPGLSNLIAERNELRRHALSVLEKPDRPVLSLGSPCLQCLCVFDKIRPGLLNSFPKEFPMQDTLSFTIPDSIITSEYNGKEALLLDTSTQRYHTLNETATLLWTEIEKGRTVSQMVDALCATFEIVPSDARSSVEKAISRLESHSLIQRVPVGESVVPQPGH